MWSVLAEETLHDSQEVFVSHTLFHGWKALVLDVNQRYTSNAITSVCDAMHFSLLNWQQNQFMSKYCICKALFSIIFPYPEHSVDPEQHHHVPRRQSQTDWLCVGPHHPELGAVETPSPDASAHYFCHFTPKCFLTVPRGEWDVDITKMIVR